MNWNKNQKQKAQEIALNYYENYLILARQYKALEAKFQALRKEKSSSPSLPPFSLKNNRIN